MTDDIGPELDAEQWAEVREMGHADDVERSAWSGDWARVIAVGNDAMRPGDRRKITRRTTVNLRALRVFIQTGFMPSLDARADLEDDLAVLIDTLESYLPPEPEQ